jgi:hypothetical protein
VFSKVTVAPGTTDPDWSFTVPTIAPKVDWPIACRPDETTQAVRISSSHLPTLERAMAHLQNFVTVAVLNSRT